MFVKSHAVSAGILESMVSARDYSANRNRLVHRDSTVKGVCNQLFFLETIDSVTQYQSL